MNLFAKDCKQKKIPDAFDYKLKINQHLKYSTKK